MFGRVRLHSFYCDVSAQIKWEREVMTCRIGWGTNRIVFLVGPFAIKVPATVEFRLFLHGLLSNMQETKFSKHKLAAPILFSFPGGFLNIMARAERLTMQQFNSVKIEDYKGLPVEDKLDSFGILHGKIVAVDYG